MGRSRGCFLVGVGLVMALGVGVGLVSYYFASPGGLKVLGEVAGPLASVLAPVAGEWWRTRRLGDSRSVDMVADLLAGVVRAQWRKAATERRLVTPEPIPVGWSLSDLPVAGPVDAAVGDPEVVPAFSPLPGQSRVTEEDLRAGGGRGELFAVYAGLASGRVVVVGAPGAGKTGSAVLLVLDALEHRDRMDAKDRARVPVPVLVTAQGWDPAICSVQDWLAARLAATYPLFQQRGGQAQAAALVATGAVALILDGLDEMDVAPRPAALQALSDAPFRVVVLTRSQEMVQAAGAGWLVGAVAVHLRDITGPEGADYLQRARTGPAPTGWTQLLTHLRDNPGSVLARGLSTPLALTLIRDTYRAGADVSDLLDAARCSTADDIEQHLIARVLPDAYTPRPGHPKPPYSQTQATQALAFLAQQMNQDHTRDLGWWQIPRWAPTRPRMLASMLAGGLAGGLLSGFLGELTFVLLAMLGAANGLSSEYGLYGLANGLGLGLVLGLAFGRGGRAPNRLRTWRAIRLRSVFLTGLAYGLVLQFAVGLVSVLAGFFAGFFVGLFAARSGADPKAVQDWLTSFVGLLVASFANGLVTGMLLRPKRDLLGDVSEGEGSHPRLVKSRRKDQVIGLGLGLVAALMTVLPGGSGLVSGLVVGLVVWFTVWLVGRLVPQLADGVVASLAVESAERESSPQGPFESWRNDRMFRIVTGLVLGLAFGLAFGLVFGIMAEFGINLDGVGPGAMVGTGIGFGFAVGLVYGIMSSGTWATTLAWRLQLQRSRRVPAVGLMPFLEDALDREVLRTVGAVYQFRHATLQDHLAGQTTASPATSLATERPS